MGNPQKICVICGMDCSMITRYQSPDGRYYCHPCYERLMQAAASTAAPAAPPPPALHIAPAEAAPTRAGTGARPGLRPPGRKRPASSPKLPFAIGGGILLVFVVLLIVARFAPIAALGYLAGFALFAFGLGLTVLVSAFRTSLVQGLLTLFIPGYSLYYVFGVSRNRVLMTLTPLCLVLPFGMLLFPGGETIADFGSEPTATQPAFVGEEAPAPEANPELSDADASQRVVAGHSVTIVPRASSTSYSKISGPRQMTMKSDGKRIQLRSGQPLQLEQWQVGKQNVMIVNNELFVDFRSYGALEPGAGIQVNNGAVLVGGKPVTERPGTVQISISPSTP